ncbi:MAG: FAD-binding protein [Pseudomonadales bacterium]
MKPGDEHWCSDIEPPLVLTDQASLDWQDTADFIVVGFGGAGAVAALRARQRGLEVIAVDVAEGGGATRASGGVLYAGGGTSVQRSNGEHDTPENMYRYLKQETGNVVADETLMRFCRDSSANLDWLMDQGVKFSGPVWKQKTSYPNVNYFLYHSDNSLLPEYQADSSPAARGHRGVIRRGRSAVNLGGAIFDPLKRQCLAEGVALKTKTEVRQLICDDRGRVIGVRCLQIPADSDLYAEHQRCYSRGRWLKNTYPFFLPGAKYVHARADRLLQRAEEIEEKERSWVNYRARLGVCLSAGGFIFNRSMVKHHCPAYQKGMPIGTPADNGAGIRLGESVSAATAHMDRATAWRFINPPIAWSQGIIVNRAGARIVNESTYGATIGDAIAREPEGKAWLILDDALVREAWWQIWPTRVLPFQWQLGALNMLFAKKKFSDLASICHHFGFDPMTLSGTLADLAKTAETDGPDIFGKPASDLQALNFPLHVIDVSIGARMLPCTVLTMGGLIVNEKSGQVKNNEGKEIDGLYAAGRTAVGIPSWLYMSGLSIADCVFSGLRAADHVSGESPS